jgi:UDP-3-O-[3-hydroxymyristoyl] glucosamine N-acyltransferase
VNNTQLAARTVGELAQVVGGRVVGDPETCIRGIAPVEYARDGDITYAESARFLGRAAASAAAAVLAPAALAQRSGTSLAEIGNNGRKTMVLVADPRRAFAQLLTLFAPPAQSVGAGIHPTAVVSNDLRAGANVAVGAQCVIGANVRLGHNVTIHPFAFVGDDVEVGDDTVIHPHVTLARGTILGARCVIHAGARLGADGFGYLTLDGKHHKVPQIGNVVVGDDVEIGANTTIDRARTGSTRIGSGTKIDNLVHIAHNCQIGEDCIVIAQVGLAGGVQVGRGAIIAGQTGVAEQIKIGAGAILGAQTGVMGDVPPNAFMSGYGPRPHKDVLKINAAMGQLPDLLRKVRALERRLADLEGTERASSDDDSQAVEEVKVVEVTRERAA